MDWTLPVNLSTWGSIDDLYYLILVITGVAFLLVEIGILWFVFKYRTGDERRAHYTHGDNRLEILWTAVPALVMVFLGIYSGQIWASIKNPDAFPDPDVTLDVAAKQFEWNITYPGADGELGTGDDFTERNHLHVPADRTVLVRLSSEDVIHSFFVPELRVKQDALPGKTTPVWFEATEPAELELACAELCGLGHYRMRAQVTVHAPDEYQQWMTRNSAGQQGS